MKKRLWVAGDHFVDRFHEGYWRPVSKRFEIEETIDRHGGASNTYHNARRHALGTDIEVRATGFGDGRKLVRYVDMDAGYPRGADVLEVWQDVQELGGSGWRNWIRHYQNEAQLQEKDEQITLVVSEYNKYFGRSNVPLGPQVDLVVVDSRYRTVPLKILKMAKTSIWRCTGLEYNEEFAKNFDWVVWTNHNKPIQILKKGIETQVGIVTVPEIEVVDPVGAGDTFTAVLAVELTLAQQISTETIMLACTKAVAAAQSVCMSKYTEIVKPRDK